VGCDVAQHQFDARFEGRVLGDDVFSLDAEEVLGAIPAAHVLGGELGGLGAAAVPRGREDAFEDDVVAVVEGKADGPIDE
jgi:hypothetical protein